MPSTKSSFVEKVLGRIDVLDPQDLQSFVERLARERSFLETLFNTVEDGVLVADANGRIIYLNDAVTRLTGYEEEMVMDQPVSRLLPDVDWDLLQAMDRDGGQGVVRREFELHVIPSQGLSGLYAAPLDGEAKGSTGMALILHDATEAREQTHEAIESERIQALTLLAASVAHELGNPLNALSIHLQLIEREVRKLRQPSGLAKRTDEPDEVNDIAAKLEKYIGVAKGEVNRLDYIVTQFLQAIRPTKPSQKKSSLNDTIEETVELLRPEFDNRGQALKFDLASDLPLAWFDAAQIKQSLINLMKNSMQAMTTGGELEIKTGEAGDGVWVSLTDSGGGIPQEQIKRIFEPYYDEEKGIRAWPDDRAAHRARPRRTAGVDESRRQGDDLSHLAAEGGTHAEIAWGKHGGRMTPNLLIVDDEKPTRDGLRAALEDRYEVTWQRMRPRRSACSRRRRSMCCSRIFGCRTMRTG